MKITQPITNVSVLKPKQETEVPENLDPTTIVLNKAPRGFIETIRLGVDYMINGNKRTVYIHVGFQTREAVYNGETFDLEHPVEAFTRDRANSTTEATMIMASQGLQAGVPPARTVKGLIKLDGSDTVFMDTPDGKQKHLTSEAQVLGWGLRLILEKRGILKNGQAVPYYELPRIGDSKPTQHNEPEASSDSESGDYPEHATVCGSCGEKAVVPMDGCDVCLNCQESKCG